MAALRFFFYLLMKPIAIGMAVLGLIGILAPYIDPNTWWIPAFSGLFMPVILIGNLFLLIFWGCHRKIWLILPLITILLNYNYLFSIFQNPWKKLPVISDAGKVLHIASYNVEGFYEISHSPRGYALLRKLPLENIDILCVQEHCEEVNLDSATIRERIPLPFRCTFFNRRTSWANFGISVYSRHPIIRHTDIDFHSETNAAMWVDILVEQDTIRVFNNHLQTTNVSLNKKKYYEYKSVKNWKGQAHTLVNLLEQLKENFQIRARQSQLVRQIIDTTRYPVIVCGDFNDTPVSYAFNHIRSHGLTDGFRTCGKGYGHSFKGIKGLLRIDFIAYDSHFVGLTYDSPSLPGSDHNPIVMELLLKKE